MIIDISEAHNEARLTGTKDFLDTGTGNARVRIYDGTKPAPGGTATTLLVEIELAKPCGTVDSGVLTLDSSDLPLVLNSGEATWARVVNGNGDWAFDCDVTDSAGDGFVKMPSTTLFAGGKVAIILGELT